MKLLLDTQVLLWAAAAPERLPTEALTLIEDPEHELYFSVASLWEIAVRNERTPDGPRVSPRELRGALLPRDYEELPIKGHHAVEVDLLPAIHDDLFDRILVAQAQRDGMTLLTTNPILDRYPGSIHVVRAAPLAT